MGYRSDYDFPDRDRFYDDGTTSGDGRRSFMAVLLALFVFILVVSVSCRQITSPEPARNMIEAGLVTLTDVDQLIADDGEALRELAANTNEPVIALPGYPLDIILTRQEVLDSSDEELRQLILERSSGLVYAQGLEAFDRTGEQSVRRVSMQGLMELGVSQVSDRTYDRATLLALFGLAGVVVFGAIVGSTGSGFGRMRTIGVAAAIGAAPALLISFVARVTTGAIGGDDPFVAGLREIAESALYVPLRNSLVVVVAGIVVAAAATVLGRVEQRVTRSMAVEDDW